MAAKKIAKPAKEAKPGESQEEKSKPEVELKRETRIDLYAAQRYLPLKAQKEVGLRMPVEVYFKDPAVAKANTDIGIDEDFTAPWEPGLRDGPTSARFVVVDYDATTNTLTPPAVWSQKRNCYCDLQGTPLTGKSVELFQFHQLSAWAMVQNTLDYFESGFGLGRRITWAFEGSRLIVLPHAGFGQNAYYDRASKSLQFYYFDGANGRVYTCLSSDIVNHEFGHAVLDGMRPYFFESITGQGAAFHEFLGDLTAILMAFRNNAFRRKLLEHCKGDLNNDVLLANLAREFGEAVTGSAYLRSALNHRTMKEFGANAEPHDLSEVLTGAMFDILKEVYATQQKGDDKPTNVQALARAYPRMQTTAIQPLDLLPPCDVTFRDYALAVLRSDEVANPIDPKGYRAMMLNVFVKRGILSRKDKKDLLNPDTVFARPSLDVFHPIDSIAASRGSAYRFLDDNRNKLLIPLNADLIVSEVVRARKMGRDGRSLPDQIVIQYVWREDVVLEGRRFGQFAGSRTSLLCGATMVLDENGNLIHWRRKPGSTSLGQSQKQLDEEKAGLQRRKELLNAIAERVAAGAIGQAPTSALGLIERATPPFGVREVDGQLRFELSPHFSIASHDDEPETGESQWQISF